METPAEKPTIESPEVTPLPVAKDNAPLPAAENEKTAVLYADSEAIANVVKKKLNKDLGDLKPKPPNLVQNVLRIAAYPIGVAAGLLFAHREARDGVEKYLEENHKFDELPHKAEASRKESTGSERLKEHKEELRLNIQDKGEEIRDWLGMQREKPKGFVNRIKSEMVEGARTINMASVDPARRARVIFNGLFATTAAMGLLLTLSDNKNFLQFKSGGDKDAGGAERELYLPKAVFQQN